MCGVIGITSRKGVVARLVDGLKRLEYRGYDSAGLGISVNNRLERRRAQGKISALQQLLSHNPLEGCVGIGHTRWATHGVPSERNAHPQGNERVLIVHNGIVENFLTFKNQLIQAGISFEGETDTEVLALLLDQALNPTPDKSRLPEILRTLFRQLRGSFACVFLLRNFPDCLMAYKQGNSPLTLGYGDGEMFCGSDAIALLGLSEKLTYLEDGDLAILTPDGAEIFNKEGSRVERPVVPNPIAPHSIDKENYTHFMRKEIGQQPQVIQSLLHRYTQNCQVLHFPDLPFNPEEAISFGITACGTAYYAGLVATSWFETFARLRVFVDIASEFRYRRPPLSEGELLVLISQSGETIDTLGALSYAKEAGQRTLSLVNVPGSSLERATDCTLQVQAGPEIGVASTKAFTAQLLVLLLLALDLAQKRGTLPPSLLSSLLQELHTLPTHFETVLALEPAIRSLAQELVSVTSVLYLGRGTMASLAYEGALKLKELSYIHAEGYPAGELKHGPIALLDNQLPVVVLAPFDAFFEKIIGNIQEIAARNSPLIILTDVEGKSHLEHLKASFIVLPASTFVTAPFIYAIALQLLAYHTACLKGTDVDQPRNLAKSVTVE